MRLLNRHLNNNFRLSVHGGPFFKRAVVVCCLLGSYSAWASPVCQLTESQDHKSLDVQFANRKITILGWRHPGETEMHNNQVAFMSLIGQLSSTATVGCAEIEKTIKARLSQQNDLIDSSYDLGARLSKLSVTAGTALAVEASASELQAADKNPDAVLKPSMLPKVADLFGAFMYKCPALENEIAPFQLISMTPPMLFWLEQKNKGNTMPIIGVDDLSARDLIFKGTSAEARAYDITSANLNSRALALAKKISTDVVSTLLPPNSSDINKLLAEIPDIETTTKVVQWLNALRVLGETGQQRNQKIVQNIEALNQDTLLVIGDAHIAGLKSIYENICH